MSRSVARVVALAVLASLLGVGVAQIGADPARFVAALGEGAERGADGIVRTAAGLEIVLVQRGGALYALEGRGELDDAGLQDLAAVVGAGTGLGDAIVEPVLGFLRGRLAGLAGTGRVVVGVERHRLALDVRGSAVPYDVIFGLTLAEVPAASLPTSRHALGPADAAIVVREFSDFQCVFCARFVRDVLPSLEEALLSRGDVRFEFHHFPLRTINPNADRAAEASECAADAHPDDPKAFWRYHDALFAHQAAWASLTDPTAYFVDLAVEADVDPGALSACLERGHHRATIDAAFEAARALRLRGTPSVFVGTFPLEDFRSPAAYLEAIGWIEAFGTGEE